MNEAHDDAPSDLPAVKQLQKQTVLLICSGQVVTNIPSVVKELVEWVWERVMHIQSNRNSLDAGATSIDIQLLGNGLRSLSVIDHAYWKIADCMLQVRDNGRGISKQDRETICQRYYTSKIKCLEDIDTLITYGFRGSTCSNTNLGPRSFRWSLEFHLYTGWERLNCYANTEWYHGGRN